MYDDVGSRVVPNLTLELANSNKVWNIQFQSWVLKWTTRDRNSGKCFQIPEKNLEFLLH